MVLIYLNSKDSRAYSSTGTIENKGYYEQCKLFEKYEHKSKNTIRPGSIDIYKDESRDEYITLNIDSSYHSQELEREEVYFNKYLGNEFLILVLYFCGQTPRYITHSEFNENNKRSKNISELHQFDENQFLTKLIEENDSINNTITYQIDKITDGYNNNINLESSSNDPDTGLTKYIHSPIKDPKTSFIIYSNQPLNELTGAQLVIIGGIQNQNYTKIEVYYSDKCDKPLLVCLISNITKECYQHKRSGEKYYFEQSSEGYEKLIGSEKKSLKETLKSTEFLFLNKVIVLIDYRSNSTYQKDQIESLTSQKPSEAQPENIVVDQKGDLCNQIKKLNYSCFYHDLFKITLSNKQVELKLFISSKSSETYNHITTYKDNKLKDEEYIHYQQGNRHLFVFFYNQDPRPLLICYGSKAFMPNSLSEYFTKWVKVTGLTDNLCHGLKRNDQLLQALHNVCLELNPVKLNELPTGDLKERKYEVQTFKNNKIEIKVKYEDLKCCRRYDHEPNNPGCRLGKLTHKAKESNLTGLTYAEDKILSSASIYYHAYDKNHRYPLLLELELKGGGITNEKKYFKPNKKGGNEWDTTSVNTLKLEEEIFKIRSNLEIKFNENERTNPLFNAEKCTEDNSDETSIIAVSVTVPTVGLGGGGIYLFRETISRFIRRLL